MYLVLLIAAALLGDGCTSANVHKHVKLDLDNNIELTDVPIKQSSSKTKFLSITQHLAPSYGHKQGDVLHLTCEALGAPAPSIHWFKNDVPVFEFDLESNELIDGSPSSVARVSSTLLVARAAAHDVYSCRAAAGDRVARTSGTVYSIDGSTEVSERSKLYPLLPQIVVWYKVYVDTIGNNIILPCRAKGHPRPRISWKNNKGVSVVNDGRMKVLRSGELMISSLLWSDMGEYVCVATNIFGSTSTKTFVYPARAG